MYDGEIIDSHMHLWDMGNPYPWLQAVDPDVERMLGDYSRLRKNFLAEDYAQEAIKHDITASVHVEAFGFQDDPVQETHWLQGQANQFGFPHAIVAYAKLDAPDVEKLLVAHSQCANTRGIRMALNWHDEPHLRMSDRADYLSDEQWRNGYSLLSKYGLSFDLQVYDHQLVEAVPLAEQFPDTLLVIEHLGWPTDFPPSGVEAWQQNLKRIAVFENVVIKLSCLGCAFSRHMNEQALEHIIQTAIDVFGTERCCFGSNHPPDGLFYSLGQVIDISKRATATYHYSIQRQLFYSNAKRIYRL